MGMLMQNPPAYKRSLCFWQMEQIKVTSSDSFLLIFMKETFKFFIGLIFKIGFPFFPSFW